MFSDPCPGIIHGPAWLAGISVVLALPVSPQGPLPVRLPLSNYRVRVLLPPETIISKVAFLASPGIETGRLHTVLPSLHRLVLFQLSPVELNVRNGPMDHYSESP